MAVAVLVWNVFSVTNSRPAANPIVDIPYSTFFDQLNAGNVSEVNVQGNALSGSLKTQLTYPEASTATQQKPSQTSDRFKTRIPDFGDATLLPALRSQTVTIDVNPVQGPSVWLVLLENLLPWVLLGGIFVFMSRRAGQAQQGIFSFGKSKARLYQHPEQRTTFEDVAGVEESKADLLDIIDYLKEPAKYQRLGGRVPRGVLLVGPPGTGKTLLARATAGEANVPFFSISGPEFVEVLVGVGASRVRDLFATAKKQPASIIFIDEIDAIGRRRGASSFGGNDEREQTLNQILVEMDGFDSNHTVIVLAASNRADVLDAALLRPGRFDRQVAVDRPDRAGREAILKVHIKDVPLADDVDLGAIARGTPGMVGADLANLVNEGALLGARRELQAVDQQCLWDALEKIQLGAPRPLILTEEDRKIVAYHEGGHALVALLLPDADPLNRVTIVPRGHALGVTLQLPLDDRYNYSRSYLLARIAVALAGRVAEELVFGEITTGAENDLEMVSAVVRQMVTRWGMDEGVGVLVQADRSEGDLGSLLSQRETSEYRATQIDAAMQAITTERLGCTRRLLSENLDKLHKLAALLLEHESADADSIRAALGLTQPVVLPPSGANTGALSL
ncbi:MAG TPA: ATP-dependent zinc metalloprotease FtsH [Chloroflexota bacterium]